MNSGDVTGIFITLILTVGFTVIWVSRLRYREKPAVGSAELRELVQRLERIEQAIDAMAVETERISEGQRFTTKLLSERTKEPAPRS